MTKMYFISQTKSERSKISTAIALTLLLTLTIFAAAGTQSAEAQTSSSASYIYVATNAQTIGVSQQLEVIPFMWEPTPTATATGGDRWTGITVTITHPDGTTELKGPLTADAVGSTFFFFTPTEVGTYTFQAHFPGQHIVGNETSVFGAPVPIDIQYQPSNSSVVSVTVQSQPVTTISQPPLPANYWTRPVNSQNQLWDSISNNWLLTGYNANSRQFDQGCVNVPVATAPTSAHVLWTQPLTFGGQIGGTYGTNSFSTGMSYEQFFKPPVIISGRLYYNTIGPEEPTSNAAAASSITVEDLATGKILFTIPNATLSFGQILNFISPNQGGGIAYLWDASGITTWKLYDAWTGQYLCSIDNIPYGLATSAQGISYSAITLDNTYNTNAGPGNVLVYTIDPTTGTMTLWNSTQVFQTYETAFTAQMPYVVQATNNPETWRIYNWYQQTLNGTTGIMWNVKLADYPAGGIPAQIGFDNTVYVMAGQVVGAYGGAAQFSLPQKSTWVGYSMTDGSKLWGPNVIDATAKIPPNSTVYDGVFQTEPIGIGADRGILPLFDSATLQWYAWNVTSGQFLWGPSTAYTNAFGYYNYETEIVVNGILYNSGYDGMIHALNAENGNALWNFSTGYAGTATPYGTWPFYNGLTVVKNAIIGTTGDHGNGAQPLYEGEGIYVLNPTSGQQLWNMTGWFLQPVIADGIMVSQNQYDNQLYAFGKGPSTITVSAPQTSVATGTSLIIQGTVMDTSPGALQLVQEGRLSYVPAISDADQTAYMSYLYEQQPMPMHATGVPVTLIATGSDGSHVTIGTTASDSLGHYAFSWTPQTPGVYSIVAEFSGTNSYWGSTAETSVVVGTVSSTGTSASVSPSAVPTVTPTPGAVPVTYIYVIAAAVVIIVIIAVAAVMLRRRQTK